LLNIPQREVVIPSGESSCALLGSCASKGSTHCPEILPGSLAEIQLNRTQMTDLHSAFAVREKY